MSGYKAYPEYKDSGIEWIGRIPSEWSLTKNKHVSKNQKGKNPPELHDEERDGMLPYLSADYLRGKKSPKFAYPENNSCIVREGEPVLIWDGSNAGEYIKGRDGILSSTMAVNLTNKNIKGEFYWYLCQCLEGELRKSTVGLGIPHVDSEELNNLFIALPNKSEQTAIATFLDRETSRIDRLIDAKKRFIERLKEKRQALISHAVTKGLDPNAPMKDSGVEWIGEIPEGWEVKALKYISSVNDEALPENTDPSLDINYIDIGSVDSIRGIVSHDRYEFKDSPSRARRIIREGDVLVSTVRTYLEAIAPVTSKENGMIASTGFAVLRPKKQLHNGFAKYGLRSRGFVSEVINSSVGISYPAINATTLMNLVIPVPPLVEQENICASLDKELSYIDLLSCKVYQSIEKLKEKRTALITAAVTGKIDVRDEA